MVEGVDRIRRRVTVSGRVQGVGFRDGVRREAERLHVAGWVANTGDTGLEAVLEGAPDDVTTLLDYCHQGPDGAQVSEIDVQTQEPSGLEGFAVR
ncbi:MAG TPA: acylphosphatase [Solirubrobacteraceae bacterium]|nr:acylphosphatase [Solirubrobacteraceae bacterium]